MSTSYDYSTPTPSTTNYCKCTRKNYLIKKQDPKKRWLTGLNSLVAVIIMGLVVGSLVFTFSLANQGSIGSSSTTGNSIRIVLVPAEKGSMPSQVEMETTRTILASRFSQFGFKGSSVNVVKVAGQPGIRIELPGLGDNKQKIIQLLVETGKLEFWDTGPQGLLVQGTSFKPEEYTKYNPGDQPQFTNADLNPHAFSVVQNFNTKSYDVTFAMQSSSVNRFQRYTSNAIGRVLTVTLDRTVLNSSIIHSELDGSGALSDNFTQQQAKALASLLKSGVLPIELKQLN